MIYIALALLAVVLVAAAYVFLAVARLPAWVVVIGFAAVTGLLA